MDVHEYNNLQMLQEGTTLVHQCITRETNWQPQL